MKQDSKELMMKGVFLISALLSIVAILLICYFIFANGMPFIFRIGVDKFIGNSKWAPSSSPPSYGILPMIYGSFVITIGAIIVGVPIGVLTAVFLAYFCPKWLYRFAKPAVNLMAAIPSIVYGFFALQLLVPLMRKLPFIGGSGMNIITASILLGIMILPTIIGLSESSIRSIPKTYFEGSICLGASKERAVMRVVLPAARSGVLSSIVLGIGRAIGETMAVILVAGNQPRIPSSVTEGVRTLTTNIVMEMAYAAGEHREALIATSAVLFILILIINSIFAYMKRKGISS